MEFTAPQRFLLNEAPAPELQDYMIALKRKPGSLELYLDKAKKAGFSNNDLTALLGFALKQGIIDMPTYKFHAGRLDLAKTRKLRKTGKFDRRDTAIHNGEDNPNLVTCVKCKRQVDTDKATLVPSQGWVCC